LNTEHLLYLRKELEVEDTGIEEKDKVPALSEFNKIFHL
jgi:hypothetical protein